MHGIDYRPGIDLTGFHLTEKLDGIRLEIRAGQAYTRAGYPVALPPWIDLSGLPDCDGELYAGRPLRPRLAGAAQSSAPVWPEATRIYLFDAAGPLPTPLPAGVALVPDLGRAASSADALTVARGVIAAGGEGIMARAPGLPWSEARCSGLVKIKKKAFSC